jgi:hypothetical protein
MSNIRDIHKIKKIQSIPLPKVWSLRGEILEKQKKNIDI